MVGLDPWAVPARVPGDAGRHVRLELLHDVLFSSPVGTVSMESAMALDPLSEHSGDDLTCLAAPDSGRGGRRELGYRSSGQGEDAAMTDSVGHRGLRVAVLTGRFSSYSDALLTALRDWTGATVEIVYQRASAEVPYDDRQFASLGGALGWERQIPLEEVRTLVDRLRPDVLYVTSWNHGAYVRLAKAWRRRALRLMFMDNPWRATAKQWGGVAISRLYLKPAFDVVFLPNERQRVFARKLGFGDLQIWDGVNCCDQPTFEGQRARGPLRSESFLYVGRLVPSKGIDLLLEAYARYSKEVDDPWPLNLVGAGSLEPAAAGCKGVVTHGFRQPSELPEIFAGAGCFVLPSRFEPWGVVLHEAAASGLPIICTSACGASLDLVRDRYNGLVVAPGNVRALTEAMVFVGTMAAERRHAMGEASVTLSRQLTPQRWADSFDERARAWLDRAGLSAHSGDDGS